MVNHSFVFLLSLTIFFHGIELAACPDVDKIGSPINIVNEYIASLLLTANPLNTKDQLTLLYINDFETQEAKFYNFVFQVRNTATDKKSYIGVQALFPPSSGLNNEYKISKYMQSTLLSDILYLLSINSIPKNKDFFCANLKLDFIKYFLDMNYVYDITRYNYAYFENFVKTSEAPQQDLTIDQQVNEVLLSLEQSSKGTYLTTDDIKNLLFTISNEEVIKMLKQKDAADETAVTIPENPSVLNQTIQITRIASKPSSTNEELLNRFLIIFFNYDIATGRRRDGKPISDKDYKIIFSIIMDILSSPLDADINDIFKKYIERFNLVKYDQSYPDTTFDVYIRNITIVVPDTTQPEEKKPQVDIEFKRPVVPTGVITKNETVTIEVTKIGGQTIPGVPQTVLNQTAYNLLQQLINENKKINQLNIDKVTTVTKTTPQKPPVTIQPQLPPQNLTRIIQTGSLVRPTVYLYQNRFGSSVLPETLSNEQFVTVQAGSNPDFGKRPINSLGGFYTGFNTFSNGVAGGKSDYIPIAAPGTRVESNLAGGLSQGFIPSSGGVYQGKVNIGVPGGASAIQGSVQNIDGTRVIIGVPGGVTVTGGSASQRYGGAQGGQQVFVVNNGQSSSGQLIEGARPIATQTRFAAFPVTQTIQTTSGNLFQTGGAFQGNQTAQSASGTFIQAGRNGQNLQFTKAQVIPFGQIVSLNQGASKGQANAAGQTIIYGQGTGFGQAIGSGQAASGQTLLIGANGQVAGQAVPTGFIQTTIQPVGTQIRTQALPVGSISSTLIPFGTQVRTQTAPAGGIQATMLPIEAQLSGQDVSVGRVRTSFIPLGTQVRSQTITTSTQTKTVPAETQVISKGTSDSGAMEASGMVVGNDAGSFQETTTRTETVNAQ